MNTISPCQLHARIAGEPDSRIIDVTTPAEFAEIHVPRSVNVPLDRLDPNLLVREGLVTAATTVYLICRTGRRAEKAARLLGSVAVAEALVVTGGTTAWVDAGLPVERGPRRTIGLERQVRIAAGALVLAGVVTGVAIHPAFYGLSAFVGAGLVFAGVTDYCGMALLLGRAPWNRRKGGS